MLLYLGYSLRRDHISNGSSHNTRGHQGKFLRVARGSRSSPIETEKIRGLECRDLGSDYQGYFIGPRGCQLYNSQLATGQGSYIEPAHLDNTTNKAGNVGYSTCISGSNSGAV